jgi:hypothetical protein
MVNVAELSDDDRELWVPDPLPADVAEAAKAYLDRSWTGLQVVGGRLLVTLGASSGVTAVRMHADLLHGLADMDLDACAFGAGSRVTIFYRHPGAGQRVSETRLRMTVGRDVEGPERAPWSGPEGRTAAERSGAVGGARARGRGTGGAAAYGWGVA